MKNKHTRRGNTQIRHAELVSASSRYEHNKTLKQVQGDGRKGFTLIELLVVVLIIGILAAVAVPQYQKAVMKSYMTQWATYIHSLDKAMEVWMLSNAGQSASTIYFTGTTATGSLDIDIPCLSQTESKCFTKLGYFHAACSPSNCYIEFSTQYDDYRGPFPKGNAIWLAKYADGSYEGERVLSSVPVEKQFRKLVCDWWVSHFGKQRMKETALTACAEIGI